MRVLAIVHQPDAGPGVFVDAIRERGAELRRWLPADGEPPPDLEGYDAVMTFGGAMHVDQEDRHPWLREEKAVLRELVRGEAPVLGVCLGAQLLAEAAGAPARRASEPEIGWHEVRVTDSGEDDALLGPLAPSFIAFGWHSYEFPLPPGATALAESRACLQAYRLPGPSWGIQFHAEVTAEDVESWLADLHGDEDAARLALDEAELRARTRSEIGRWNDLGRALCGRFLAAVTRA